MGFALCRSCPAHSRSCPLHRASCITCRCRCSHRNRDCCLACLPEERSCRERDGRNCTRGSLFGVLPPRCRRSHAGAGLCDPKHAQRLWNEWLVVRESWHLHRGLPVTCFRGLAFVVVPGCAGATGRREPVLAKCRGWARGGLNIWRFFERRYPRIYADGSGSVPGDEAGNWACQLTTRWSLP